jgi:hypothetical protein
MSNTFNRNNITLGPTAFSQPVISGSGATRSLNETESGSVVLMDRAAGIVFTLPAAATVGTFFDFIVTTSATSNAYKVITGAGTELLTGGYLSVDTDSSNAAAVFTGNGSTHVAVNMTAAASNALGGLKGTKLRFTCLSSTLWEVEGMVMCGGTPATAFATS